MLDVGNLRSVLSLSQTFENNIKLIINCHSGATLCDPAIGSLDVTNATVFQKQKITNMKTLKLAQFLFALNLGQSSNKAVPFMSRFRSLMTRFVSRGSLA